MVIQNITLSGYFIVFYLIYLQRHNVVLSLAISVARQFADRGQTSPLVYTWEIPVIVFCLMSPGTQPESQGRITKHS